MEVIGRKKTVVDGGQDAFGASLGDVDFAADFGDFGKFGESGGFGDNSEAFLDASGTGDFFKTDDHTADTEPLDNSSPDSSNKSDNEEEDEPGSAHGSRRHERKPVSRRGNLSSQSKDDEEEGSGSHKRAPPMRRRSSSRRMMADGMGLQAPKPSSRSRSNSVDKEILEEEEGEGDEDDSNSKEKEHSTSGHSSRRDSLRSSRSNQSTRRPGLTSENHGRGAGAGGRPGMTSHPRRQMSSRRLLASADGTGPKKLDTQLSVRNLFSTGELEVADSDATPASEETTACIVSHSVVHRPSSRRSLMSKDPRRGVAKSASMNQKVDRPSGPRAAPPQRAKSAMIRRPPSGRFLSNTEPEGEDDTEPATAVPAIRPPRGGPRAAPPTKSLSTGANGASAVSRRHLHRAAQAEKKHEESDEPEKPLSMRRHQRRRGGSHGDKEEES